MKRAYGNCSRSYRSSLVMRTKCRNYLFQIFFFFRNIFRRFFNSFRRFVRLRGFHYYFSKLIFFIRFRRGGEYIRVIFIFWTVVQHVKRAFSCSFQGQVFMYRILQYSRVCVWNRKIENFLKKQNILYTRVNCRFMHFSVGRSPGPRKIIRKTKLRNRHGTWTNVEKTNQIKIITLAIN